MDAIDKKRNQVIISKLVWKDSSIIQRTFAG